MLADEKKSQNIRVRMPEGDIYTVDEVSGLLSIPRPTLYRYLREYSIPHLRREGRISIPEDSFDRIREARDLHKEGLGKETVRRQLREGSAPDSEELDRRLNDLYRTVEGLREDIKVRPTTGDVAFSPTSQRTILARQSLLMSAVFNLTEMVEDLLLASGKPRKPVLEGFVTEEALPGSPDLQEIPGEVTVGTATLARPHPEGAGLALDTRSSVFGASRRRRRRGGLAILAALLFLACLAWTIPNLMGAGNTGPSVPRLAHTADERLEPPRALAVPADSGAEGRIKVPDVSGQSLEHAVSSISAAGFEVAEIRTEANSEDARTALRTEPKAGSPTKPGAPVVLTMDGRVAPAVQTASASASAYGGPR